MLCCREIVSATQARLQFVTSAARKSRRQFKTTSRDCDLGPSQFVGEVCDGKATVHIFTTHPGITADAECEAFSIILKLFRSMFTSLDSEPTAVPNGPNTGGHMVAMPHTGSEMFDRARRMIPNQHFQVMLLHMHRTSLRQARLHTWCQALFSIFKLALGHAVVTLCLHAAASLPRQHCFSG